MEIVLLFILRGYHRQLTHGPTNDSSSTVFLKPFNAIFRRNPLIYAPLTAVQEVGNSDFVESFKQRLPILIMDFDSCISYMLVYLYIL